MEMEMPKNLKEVQQLAGRVAELSRFIAKLGEKALAQPDEEDGEI